MYSELTGHVSISEWRWVILIASTLLLIVFLPFVLVALQQAGMPDWEFMGALHWYRDAAASLSRIVQGSEGEWLVTFMHTPDRHRAALIEPLYPLLGQISRWTIQSPALIFHVARVFAAFVMYLAIYQLGASIWLKVRTRRVFFIIASIGSGLGWLYAFVTSLDGMAIVPDLVLPQIYPFYAALVNVHFPLAIAAMALLASFLIPVFRPGEHRHPSVNNEALPAFLLSLALAFIYPDALIPLLMAFSGSVIVQWITRRTITVRGWRWGLWVIVPALPIGMYYLITMLNNDAVSSWLSQRGNQVPSVPMLLVGLGVPLILALPGLWRAVREFEPDGDRFMLMWLAAMLLLGYLPLLPIHTSFWVGLLLPVAYFAARSMEDFWFEFLRRRNWRRFYILGIPLICLSNLFMLLLPLPPILQGWENVNGNVLDKGYLAALQQTIRPSTNSTDVVLASPDVSAWVPVWGYARVVYGHPEQTIDAEARLDDVRAWYEADQPTDPICQSLLRTYDIDYIIVGPRELLFGNVACAQTLRQVARYGDVRVFLPLDTP